jgi:hypothetical protein
MIKRIRTIIKNNKNRDLPQKGDVGFFVFKKKKSE